MLELVNIQKSYNGKALLDGITFSVPLGETVCLLGASGSGKSTLLRIVAGLEDPEAGRVLWNGEDLSSTPAHRRNFGLVFQDYALFPHLDVAGNIAFGLKIRKLATIEIENRINTLLETVNLVDFAHRRVTELSGGEQQRVALARALAPNPRLIMFDEPLGALDRTLKDSLLVELRLILHQTGIPAIYVTHDQAEAFAIADRILLLHEGKIIQEGSPADVYSHPASAWVAEFLDVGNVITGVVREGKISTPFGSYELSCDHVHPEGATIQLLIGKMQGKVDSQGKLSGIVTEVTFQQEGFHIILDNGLKFIVKDPPELGMKIRMRLDPPSIYCLP